MTSRRIAAVIAGVLLVAGCSSKPADKEPETPPTGHGNLAECLKSHGVQDSGGPAVLMGPPAGVDQGTWDKAMQSCSSLAPGPAAP